MEESPISDARIVALHVRKNKGFHAESLEFGPIQGTSLLTLISLISLDQQSNSCPNKNSELIYLK